MSINPKYRSLLLFCLPLLVASIILMLLIQQQGLRFKLSEASRRLDGTYQITLQANMQLDKNSKPDVLLEPQVTTDVVINGNRLNIITKQPLATDTTYTVRVSNAISSMGLKQTKSNEKTFQSAPAKAFGIRRNGGADTIEEIRISNNAATTKTVVLAQSIIFIGVSPDYFWWSSSMTDGSQQLFIQDRVTGQQKLIPIPEQSIIEQLQVAKESNDAVCIITSRTQTEGQSLANEHSVHLVSGDQLSVTKLEPPMHEAAAALITPDGSALITQGRDGNVFAQNLQETNATPLGRTRLAGPFSGDSASLLLRSFEQASAYRLESGQKEDIATIPTYAAQLQANFTGKQFVYTVTDFNDLQSGVVRLYHTSSESNATPKQLYELPQDTYSSRLASTAPLQYTAIELFKKGAQFDSYAGNAKPVDAVTIVINESGQKIAELPLTELQWE